MNSTTPYSPGRRNWLGWAAAATALSAAGVAAWRYGGSASGVPQPPAGWWQQRLLPAHGDVPVALENFRTQPVLLNFWATWCPPCIRELPLLNSFHRQAQTHGVHVLGIAVDRQEAVQRFLKQRSVGFPVLLAGDAGMELAQPLGNTRNALPFSVLFNASGQALQHRLGELDQKTLDAWVALARERNS